MYRIDLRDAQGRIERSVVREVAWFPPWDGSTPPPGTSISTPPIPALMHIWEDDQGRLWTYSLVPDPDWEPNIPVDPKRISDWSRRTFDMVVEVLDPERGEVIAQTKRERLGIICGSPWLYDVVEDDMGNTQVQILEPLLLKGPRTR